MISKINWKYILEKEKKMSYFKKIKIIINQKEKNGIIIYPPKKNIFNAFNFTKLQNVKVVILGQDPYHGYNQANGLAFSVKKNITIPPSLKNIYKELVNSIPNFKFPNHGDLKFWAKQGVLLLNTILTVDQGKPKSHANIGWEIFSNKIIKILNIYCNGIIFLLWGLNAKKFSLLINNKKHFILTTSHPSPLSVNLGFFGCNHFSKTNYLLQKQNKKPINWSI